LDQINAEEILVKPPPTIRRRLLFAGTFAIALHLCEQALADAQASRPTRMPTARLEDLHGNFHQLNGYQDKVVVVNFWATWCPPCRAEMPSIEHLYQSLKGSNFEVLGINQGETAEKIKGKMGMFNPPPTFPILLDPRSEVGHYFGVEDLPMTLIFNKKGLLVGRADGARDFNSAAIRQKVAELLSQ
jgi:thiol-disulfide isomerase/thioredoxin